MHPVGISAQHLFHHAQHALHPSKHSLYHSLSRSFFQSVSLTACDSGASDPADESSRLVYRSQPSSNMAVVKHVKGDLFSAPRGSILLHACNCQGVWGGGIAAAFKKRYPNAYTIYRDHCKETPKNKLLGSTLLIPLDAQGNVISKGISNGKSTRSDEGAGGNADADVVVGCLFTSGGGGSSGCDGVDEILDATQKALAHLKDQMGSSGADDITMGKRDVAACKFNSGIFNVPWERTEQVIEGSGVQMTVYSG